MAVTRIGHVQSLRRHEQLVARAKNAYRFLPDDRSALIDSYAFCARLTISRSLTDYERAHIGSSMNNSVRKLVSFNRYS